MDVWAEDDLRRAGERALGLFKKFTNRVEDAASELYLEIPSQMTRNRPMRGDSLEKDRSAVQTNPYVFLTGVRDLLGGASFAQETAPQPSLSVVLAEYGNGKTELLHQMSDRLLQRREGPLPLPVALASCRRDWDLLENREHHPPERFFRFLLQNVLRELDAGQDFVAARVLPAFRRGEILLILDGLDELVRNPTQYQSFFQGLGSLFAAHGQGSVRGRTVVSMRLENYQLLDAKGTTLPRVFRSASGARREPPVFFLHLDFFDEPRVRLYLQVNTPGGGGEDLYDGIAEHNPWLAAIIRRPLLLRIFGDLARSGKLQREELLAARDPVELFDRYVLAASEEAKALQESLSRDLVWNPEKIARRSLGLYKERREHFRPHDVTWLIDSTADRRPEDLSPAEALVGIHKCPFLLLSEGENDGGEAEEPWGLSFSHRSFLEYFTAKGMAQGVKENAGRPTAELNELVLNVDMRKFLRSLLNHDEGLRRLLQSEADPFDEVTRESYGLDHWQEWPEGLEPAGERWQELNRARIELLHAMTDPEESSQGSRDAIVWFLREQKRGRLHPGYLMYNYESVAVYLGRHFWSVQELPLKKAFGAILRARLEETLAWLEGRSADDRLVKIAWLLVERILDIGLRLRYRWVQRFQNERPDFWRRIPYPDTRERVRTILADIADAIFS